MAAPVRKVLLMGQNFVSRNTTTGNLFVNFVCRAPMSVWRKEYTEPTVDIDVLSQPLDEADDRRYRPIKPANPDQNTGVTFDPDVAKFTNYVMRKGKKKLARYMVERAFENVKRIQIERYHKAATEEERNKIELDPVKIFHQAVNNCKPILILKRTVKGGVAYQVPFPITEGYQRFKAMNWIIETCKDKDRRLRFYDKLAWELLEAAQNEGKSVRKKQDLHRQCEANKAYAHFRW